jgi:hypothetical protein
MNIKYSCPYWGSDRFSPATFIDKIIEDGYEGAELFLQPLDLTSAAFLNKIDSVRVTHPNFYFIALQLTFPSNENIDSYISKMSSNFLQLAQCNPLFINSHTGKDYYSFDENCKVIEALMNLSAQTGVRVLHETHRGRFSFHPATLLPYLKKFPEMELVGDFSHFCTVSESMLEDQEEILQQIIPHVGHIHARIGFEQGSQVNNPAAPEWKHYLDTFTRWWQQIIDYKKNKRIETFTISPEFGPEPYMPVEPFTQKPLSSQWDNNVFMMKYLKATLI